MTDGVKRRRQPELGDLLNENPATIAPSADASPELIEKRLLGLVTLANCASPGRAQITSEAALKAFRKGGVLAQLIRRALVGDVTTQRRRKPNEKENWRRFVLCELVNRLTPSERMKIRGDFEAACKAAPGCKESSSDIYAIAAFLDGETLQAGKRASDRYRKSHERARWQSTDVPTTEVLKKRGVPLAPPGQTDPG